MALGDEIQNLVLAPVGPQLSLCFCCQISLVVVLSPSILEFGKGIASVCRVPI